MSKRKLSAYKRELLNQAQDICDDEDRSTEYMIQFMQDYAGCSHDQVMDFILEGAELIK
jgi:hypothetical protein